jgi:hypothetical protein
MKAKTETPSYTIRYHFELGDKNQAPHPGLLEAIIEIDGEPHEHLVKYVYRSQEFRPTSGTPCTQAVAAAIKRLTDWKKMWDSAPKKSAKIIHKNCRLGESHYEVDVSTEVHWQGFTWSTVNSTYYVDYAHEPLDIVNTDRREMEVELPVDAVVTHPGEDDGFGMEDLANLLRGIV